MPRFQAMVKMLELLERRLHPHHRAAPPRLLGRALASACRRTATSISTNTPAGTRCATKPTTTRTRRASTTRGSASASSGTPVEWVEEESYFFRLSAYQDKLLDLYASDPNYVLPKERLNEVASFVRGGLKDLSISRTTFDWGVTVPGDPRPHHVCVGRRAHQLHHRRRLSRHRQREIPPLLAGRPARDRQGHRALPRRVLAGVPDVGGRCRAAPHLLPRLSVQPRREDVEVGRQRASIRSRSPRPTASISSAISSCARCRSARTATTATRRSSTASTPISPTISAIWRSAR